MVLEQANASIPFYQSAEEDLHTHTLTEALRDWQRVLKAGDYYVRHCANGYTILGEILADAEHGNHVQVREYSFVYPAGTNGQIHRSQIGGELTRMVPETSTKAPSRRCHRNKRSCPESLV